MFLILASKSLESQQGRTKLVDIPTDIYSGDQKKLTSASEIKLGDPCLFVGSQRYKIDSKIRAKERASISLSRKRGGDAEADYLPGITS